MAYTIGSSSLIAATGLNQNLGFGINPDLSTAVSNYNNMTSIRKFVAVLNSITSAGYNPKNATIEVDDGEGGTESIPNPYRTIYTLGSSTLPWMVSTVPSAYTNTFARQQAYETVINRCNYILGGGDISGFITAFNRSRGFAQNSELYMRSVNRANRTIASMGTGIFTNYASLATSGFSILGEPSALATDFNNLGKYGYFDKLDRLGSPAVVVGHIIKANLADSFGLTALLNATGLVNVNLYDSQYEQTLVQILNQLSIPRHLIRFKDYYKMGFTPVNFNDLTDALKIFPTSSATNNFETLNELGTLFNQIGNFERVENYGALGSLLSDLDYVDEAGYINSLENLVTPEVLSFITSQYGGGTGEYGNVVIDDMMGSLAGVNTTPGITAATTFHQTAESAGITSSLNGHLDQLVALFNGDYDTTDGEGADHWDVPGFGSFDTLEEAYLTVLNSCEQDLVNISVDPTVESILDNTRTLYTNIFLQIAREQTIEANTGLPFSTFVNRDVNGITTFASILPQLGQEANIKNYLELVVSSDLYGDAIRIALAEGINLERIFDASIYQVGQSTQK